MLATAESWNDRFGPFFFAKCIFSVTRRSRSDESHSLTDLLTYLLDVSIDFTDVTLVSEDTHVDDEEDEEDEEVEEGEEDEEDEDDEEDE